MGTKSEGPVVLNDCQLCYSVHPGSILQEELKERGIKQKDFAKEIGMKAPHLSALIHGNRNISTAIASKIEAVLGIPASVWLNLQNQYDLYQDRMKENMAPCLVDGYARRPESYATLGDPGQNRFDSGAEIRLMLPESDLQLLYSLARRMGWKIVG